MSANPKLGENDPSSTPIVASVARKMILPKAFNDLVKVSASTSGSNDRQDSFKRVARNRSLPFQEAQAQLLNPIFCEEGQRSKAAKRGLRYRISSSSRFRSSGELYLRNLMRLFTRSSSLRARTRHFHGIPLVEFSI